MIRRRACHSPQMGNLGLGSAAVPPPSNWRAAVASSSSANVTLNIHSLNESQAAASRCEHARVFLQGGLWTTGDAVRALVRPAHPDRKRLKAAVEGKGKGHLHLR